MLPQFTFRARLRTSSLISPYSHLTVTSCDKRLCRAVGHFDGWSAEITTLLDADKDSLFMWALNDREALERWSTATTTLLGDAAIRCYLSSVRAQTRRRIFREPWPATRLRGVRTFTDTHFGVRKRRDFDYRCMLPG
jgi:hypothetical protein